MRRNMVETVLGAVVLIVAAAFLVFALRTGDVGSVDGYTLKAIFLKAGGLETGSDVRISGVKVGTVTGRHLDTETFEAVVEFTIQPDIKLPSDTAAIITNDGLLGGKYMRLVPGSDAKILEPGENLLNAQDFKTLEDQVAEIIFLATDASDGEGPQ